MYKFYNQQHHVLKLSSASENVGKDELGDTSLHLRVDKLFHHIHLELFKKTINLPKKRAKPVSTKSPPMPESLKQKQRLTSQTEDINLKNFSL